MSIKPLADRVLVEPAAAETKTSSGIIIPDSAKEKPQKGTVVAVGSGTKENPMTVKVGDTVMYAKDQVGDPIKLGEEKYFLISEHQLLGILKK